MRLISLRGSLKLGSLFYFALKLSALPVYNPAAPALLSNTFIRDCSPWFVDLKFGYRGEFVSNRKLYDVKTGVVSAFGFYSNCPMIALDLFHRLDIYTFYGPAYYTYEADVNRGVTAPLVKARSKNNSILGVGGKWVIWESYWGGYGTTYVGLDAQVETLKHTPFKFVTVDGKNVSAGSIGYRYRDEQASLGIAHHIKKFVPYAAVTYSSARAHIVDGTIPSTPTVTIHNLKNQSKAGWALGLSYVDIDRMQVTCEYRFRDERGFSVDAELIF